MTKATNKFTNRNKFERPQTSKQQPKRKAIPLQMPSLERQNYRIVHQLGSGSFGKVYKAVHLPDNLEVALKVIDLESTEDDIADLEEEVKVISECENEHITKYYGSFVYRDELWIVMELLSGGSCLDLIKYRRPELIAEPIIAEIMAQFLEGLEYLHKTNKIHRDVKAANILVSGDGVIKIADFGVAAQISTYMSKRNTFVGTPFWMAPEVIMSDSGAVYSFSADVWSVGITAIELAQSRPPHSNIEPMKAIWLIPERPPPTLPSSFSPEFQDFVKCCLQRSPSSRSTVSALLNHPFLRRRSIGQLKKLVKEVCENKKVVPYKGQQPSDSNDTTSNDEAEFEDLDWDFETVRPESVTQILDGNLDFSATNSTSAPSSAPSCALPSAKQSLEFGSSTPQTPRSNRSSHSDFNASTLINHPGTPSSSTPSTFNPNSSSNSNISTLRTVNKSTINDSTLRQSTLNTITSHNRLSKIFTHAGRKFKSSVLTDIGSMLKAEPPTPEISGYLFRKIGKHAAQQFDLKSNNNFDQVEQILVNGYLKSLRER